MIDFDPEFTVVKRVPTDFYKLEANFGPDQLGEMSDLDLVLLSLGKWVSIVSFLQARPNVIVSDEGDKTCALCMVYWRTPNSLSCGNCPVALKSNANQCHGTPYRDYSDAVVRNHPAAAHIAAQNIVVYLMELKSEIEKGSPRE